MKGIDTASGKGTSKWLTAGMCFAFSVVLHVVITVMICLRIIMLQTDVEEVKKEVEKDEMVISIKLETAKPPQIPPSGVNAPLTPQELKELAAKPPVAELPKTEVPKPSDLNQYARTTSDQLTGEVPETNLEGERDTVAASNANVVASAPEQASVSGEEPKDGRTETVDTTFQDGDLAHMNKGGEASEARIIPPSELVPDMDKTAKVDQEEIKSSVESTDDPGKELDKGELAETNKERKEYLNTEQKVAMNNEMPTSKNVGSKENEGLEEERKTIANKQLDPDGLKQKAQEEKQKKQKSQPKKVANRKASQDADKGFRSEAKATVMEGSISRRSNIASSNVKSTPMGKYMAQVSKLVEQEWQRRCMMHADIIQPGTLRIGFLVDENGRLFNKNTISKTYGSENQRGLTYQALDSVKIPPMPKEVRKSQGGDPLEFRYYFRFQ